MLALSRAQKLPQPGEDTQVTNKPNLLVLDVIHGMARAKQLKLNECFLYSLLFAFR